MLCILLNLIDNYINVYLDIFSIYIVIKHCVIFQKMNN